MDLNSPGPTLSAMHFCQLWKMLCDPALKIDGTEILVLKPHKFLGPIFNTKLSFIPYIKELRLMDVFV